VDGATSISTISLVDMEVESFPPYIYVPIPWVKAHQNYRGGAPSLGNLLCSKLDIFPPCVAAAAVYVVWSPTGVRDPLLISASRKARCRSVEPYVVIRRSRRSHLDPWRRSQPAVEVTVKAALAFLSSSLALGCLCALSPTCAGTCHLLFEPRAIGSLQSALRYRRPSRWVSQSVRTGASSALAFRRVNGASRVARPSCPRSVFIC
jgi:hypothetical protein